MARARLLSPSFFTDERVVSCCFPARLLFEGLWCESDREGRLEDKPLALKMRLFPADAVDVKALLDELEGAGLIMRYQAAGRAYLLVPRFKEHQHVHPKESPSKLPPPPWLPAETRENERPKAAKSGHDEETRAPEPCMDPKPGPEPHGEGVNPSDPQALGSSRPSGPSDVQALKPSVGATKPPGPPEPRPPEDKNSQWDDHANAFVDWAKTQWHTLEKPGPKVYDWARAFFRKHQPDDVELIRAAFARFLIWCHQSGKTVGWGLWLSDNVWETRWNDVRAEAQRRSA